MTTNEWPEIIDFTDGIGDVSEVQRSDLFSLQGDHFNIEAVCPGYLPESQSWATWRRDERGRVIVSGYDPDEDECNHWLCHCGNFITHGGRCGCGNEPPWGADDGEDWYDDDLDGGFFDDDDIEVRRIQDWDELESKSDYWLSGDVLESRGWE